MAHKTGNYICWWCLGPAWPCIDSRRRPSWLALWEVWAMQTSGGKAIQLNTAISIKSMGFNWTVAKQVVSDCSSAIVTNEPWAKERQRIIHNTGCLPSGLAAYLARFPRMGRRDRYSGREKLSMLCLHELRPEVTSKKWWMSRLRDTGWQGKSIIQNFNQRHNQEETWMISGGIKEWEIFPAMA